MSGNETVDNTCQDHTDVTLAPSTGELSPKSNSAASQKSVSRLVCVISTLQYTLKLLLLHQVFRWLDLVPPVTIVQPQPPHQIILICSNKNRWVFQDQHLPFAVLYGSSTRSHVYYCLGLQDELVRWLSLLFFYLGNIFVASHCKRKRQKYPHTNRRRQCRLTEIINCK